MSTRPYAALAALSVSTFLYVTTETLPVGLLQPIARELAISPSAVGLLVTYYGLVVVVASLPLTHLTRHVSRRVLVCVLMALFVVSSVASALAGSYLTLLLARMVTAASQAVFWSVVVPIVAGLFAPEVRGRAIAVVFGGSSLAAVVGVPVGTWLGQQFGWRWAFVALGCAGAVVLGAIATWLPAASQRSDAATGGSRPDRRRYWTLIGMTALFTTGTFTFFTYLSPFLADTVLLSAGLISVVLLVRGLAGLAGVAVGGALVDHRPRLAIAMPVAVQFVALLLLVVFARQQVLAVVLIGLTGYAFAAFTTPLSARILEVAPGRVDLAVSGTATAVNVGITAGALIGGALLAGPGPGGTVLAGALLTGIGLCLVVLDRPRPVPDLVAPAEPDRELSGAGAGAGGTAGVSWADSRTPAVRGH